MTHAKMKKVRFGLAFIKHCSPRTPDKHFHPQNTDPFNHFYLTQQKPPSGKDASFLSGTNNKIPPSSSASSSYSVALIAASFCCFMSCSLPSGYNIGVVNTPQKILTSFCNESFFQGGTVVSKTQLDLLWSTVVSTFLIGAMIGSSASAWAAGSLGRKTSVITCGLLSLVGTGFFLSAPIIKSVLCLLLGRLLTGVHCGMSSSLVPMYLMEISPPKYRSSMGVLHSLGMTVGILIAQTLGQESILGSKALWPFLVSGYAWFILLGFLALFKTPESPTYVFMTLDNETEAFNIMELLYGPANMEVILEDFHSLKQEKKLQMENFQQNKSNGFLSSLKNKSIWRSLFIVCMLHIGQQLSGINAVFYYSTKMFENVGFNEKMSQMGSIGVAVVNVIVGLISLPVIKNFNKKPLLIFSITSSALFLTLLTINSHIKYLVGDSISGYASIAFVMSYVFCYGLGLGPIAYMIGSDLLDSSSRAFGMSLGCFFNWTFNFFVGISFPSLESALGENVYAIFAISCVILVIIVFVGLEGSTSEDTDSFDNDVFRRKESDGGHCDPNRNSIHHDNNASITVIRSRC